MKIAKYLRWYMYYFGLIIPHCTKVLTLPSINVYDLYMKSFSKSTRELENVKKTKINDENTLYHD